MFCLAADPNSPDGPTFSKQKFIELGGGGGGGLDCFVGVNCCFAKAVLMLCFVLSKGMFVFINPIFL